MPQLEIFGMSKLFVNSATKDRKNIASRGWKWKRLPCAIHLILQWERRTIQSARNEKDGYRRRKKRRWRGGNHLQKRDLFPWEKVPFVPRPSLVPEPFTVWGRKKQDPKKEFYQYATIKDKEGTVRGKNVAKDDHTRQLIEGGAVSKVGLDAAAELASRGHVFEKGILSRQPGGHRHAMTPATGRTKILMALQKPSWYRF